MPLSCLYSSTLITSATIRDIPCEEKLIRKLLPVGQWVQRTSLGTKRKFEIDIRDLRDSPCEEKFDNSQIRDNKTATIRDIPCEE